MPVAPFDGALAVVTGAGSGIGRATALALAERGATVLAADIDGAAAERTAVAAKALGPAGLAYPVDVSDAAAMEGFAAAVRTEHRVPDIVVNNAGITVTGPLLDTGLADLERLMGVNLWGVIHGCRLFGRQMLDRSRALPVRPDPPNKGGHIVNIASAAAYAPTRVLPAYCTSKAAVLMLSECLRAELAGANIGVTAVCPGFVDTPMAEHTTYVGADSEVAERTRRRAARALRLRGYPPEKVAERVVTAILKNKPMVPVNFEGHVLRGMSRVSPGSLRLLARVRSPF